MSRAHAEIPKPVTLEEATAQNVQSVHQLQRAADASRSFSENVSQTIAGFCGSFPFFVIHAAWFGAWILWNVIPGTSHFDAFPFSLLVLVVSLEAIFLSAFILNSENTAKKHADRRSHLDLQINLLAEQENTKMLLLAGRIAERLGIPAGDDPTLEVLEAATRPDHLAEQIEEAGEKSTS